MASVGSSLGVGSGLDLTGLLEKLSKAEQQRLVPYNNQQSSYNAKLTGYGTLKGVLEKFDNLNKELAKSDFFNTTSASEHTQFTVTSSAGSVAGSYRVDVHQLAQAQLLTTKAAISNQNGTLGQAGASERSISITAGDPPKEVNILLTDDQTSLSGIRDAINKANAGVSATIMHVGDNNYQLALSSTTSGEKNTIKVQVNNDEQLAAVLNYDPSLTDNALKESVKAQDAKISINGTVIKRSTNTINDALQGVSITLKTTTKSEEPQDLVISADKNNTIDKIKEWVNSYNALLDTLGSLTKYTSVKSGENQSTKNGSLLGDNTLRGIQSAIKNSLSTAQDNPELKGLGNLGITTNSQTGKLELNESKLKTAFDDKPAQVANFFSGNGKDSGMATEIHNHIQNYIKTGGVIENANKSINTNLDRLNTQVARVTESIENTIARYKQQFVQLDTLLAKLNGTSDYLTQQFAPKK